MTIPAGGVPPMTECESLIHQLDSGDPRVVRQAAFDLADSGCLEAAPCLLQMFHESGLDTMGALAYALGELHVQEAKPRLLELMKDPRTRGSRGSLMYALMVLDCNDDYEDILDFTRGDTWEVRQKALIILDEIAPFQSTDVLVSGRARLIAWLEDASLGDEARSHLAEAVEAHDIELRSRENLEGDEVDHLGLRGRRRGPHAGELVDLAPGGGLRSGPDFQKSPEATRPDEEGGESSDLDAPANPPSEHHDPQEDERSPADG